MNTAAASVCERLHAAPASPAASYHSQLKPSGQAKCITFQRHSGRRRLQGRGHYRDGHYRDAEASLQTDAPLTAYSVHQIGPDHPTHRAGCRPFSHAQGKRTAALCEHRYTMMQDWRGSSRQRGALGTRLRHHSPASRRRAQGWSSLCTSRARFGCLQCADVNLQRSFPVPTHAPLLRLQSMQYYCFESRARASGNAVGPQMVPAVGEVCARTPVGPTGGVPTCVIRRGWTEDATEAYLGRWRGASATP